MITRAKESKVEVDEKTEEDTRLETRSGFESSDLRVEARKVEESMEDELSASSSATQVRKIRNRKRERKKERKKIRQEVDEITRVNEGFEDYNQFAPLYEMDESMQSEPEIVVPKIRAMTTGETDPDIEDFALRQSQDIELGPIVNLRIDNEERPSIATLSKESEVTKKLALKWERLQVRDGLVYLQEDPIRPGEARILRLLLPRNEVQEAIRLCHAGTVGGHFGTKKTTDQVRRRFYWNRWKENVKRFCKKCDECSRYHREKRKKQGVLQPVAAGAPFERWYIDLTGPHPMSDRGNIWILTCICLLYTSPSPRD